MNWIKQSLCFLICFGPLWSAQAAYITMTRKQIIKSDNERKARRKAIDKITDDLALELIKKEIGDQRFQENSEKIREDMEVLKKRFIPFFKILKSEKALDSYHFEVEVKVSMEDLRQILKERGLFMGHKKTGIILPFVEVNNQINGESYHWWSSGLSVSKELETLAHDFERELYQGFLDKGFFMLRPQAFKMVYAIPDFLRKVYLTQTEMAQITDFKKGQLYLNGQVNVLASPLRENAYRVRTQIICKQSSNARTVAQVTISVDTVSGRSLDQVSGDIRKMALEASRDLAGQVYDLWQRGAFETQILQLIVTGDLNHKQIHEFKGLLDKQFGIKNGLIERLFEPGRVTFEIDYAEGVETLLGKLKKTKFKSFISQVVSSQAGQIILDVKPAQ